MKAAFRVIPAILAVICLIGFVPWTLGIPGVENDYARGWMIGYQAIVFYVLAYAILVAIGLIIRIAKFPVPRIWLDGAGMLMVAGFTIAQLFAWPLILSTG